jgi:hypothetical protein
MKKYLLLKDNKECGPYTLAELSAIRLKKFDLIWVEGASTQWEYACRFDELKPFIAAPTPTPVFRPEPVKRRENTDVKYKPFVELPVAENQAEKNAAISTQDERSIPEIKFEQPLGEIKERYIKNPEDQKFQFQSRFRKNSGAWILALFIFLIGGAFVIKNIIDATTGVTERKPVAAAIPLAGLPEGTIPAKPAESEYKNALTMEVAAVDSTTKKPEGRITLKELKKKVTVSSNKYKVRMFGSVDDLQLNVNNNSAVKLDKVNIRVIYFKPDGEEVNSSVHSIYSLPPGSTKILVIPPGKRGVKVKAFVYGVESKQPNVSQI